MTKIGTSVALALSLTCITTLQADEKCEVKYKDHVLHYADEDNEQTPKNHLITIDYKNMKLLAKKELDGTLNHHADPMGFVSTANYMLLIPKGSNFVSVYEIKSGKFIKKIRLPFRPRSADAYNPKKNLVLLNSRDRPAAVLLDPVKLKIVGIAGFNIKCDQNKPNPYSIKELAGDENIFDLNYRCHAPDFGGDQISGHPIWISSDAFAILDRANRKIEVYKISKDDDVWNTKLIQVIDTDTSMHQLIPKNKKKNVKNRVYYGSTEGNIAEGKKAGVYKFVRHGDYLKKVAFTPLEYDDINGYQGHNLYITPDLKDIYAPSGTFINSEGDSLNSGGVFILDADSMEVEKAIKTGKGAGHVAFSKEYKTAIVTNHKDEYITAIDYENQEFIKNIPLDFPHANIASLYQSHMQHVSEDGRYYYNFWTDGGVFFRVDLDSLEVDKSIEVDGQPIQGNFYDHIAINCDLPKPSKSDGYDRFFSNDNPYSEWKGYQYFFSKKFIKQYLSNKPKKPNFRDYDNILLYYCDYFAYYRDLMLYYANRTHSKWLKKYYTQISKRYDELSKYYLNLYNNENKDD